MFKRRKPRSYSQMASDMFYPRGGWRRAGTYVVYRLRRLPDQPHRISRGVAAGIFVSFTPTFGLHFALAATCAWLIRGNILAALLATFVGNPITFPFIAVLAVSLGRELLGLGGQLSPQLIFSEFTRASAELWYNLRSVFGPEQAQWENLGHFIRDVYWPYFVGGTIIGLLVSTAAHYMTVPVIRAYHKRREKKMAARIARVRLHQQAADTHISEGAAEPETPGDKARHIRPESSDKDPIQ